MTIEQIHKAINICFILTSAIGIPSALAIISGINNWNEIIITIGLIGTIVSALAFTFMISLMWTLNDIEIEENENAN